jgi:hypothetical protein
VSEVGKTISSALGVFLQQAGQQRPTGAHSDRTTGCEDCAGSLRRVSGLPRATPGYLRRFSRGLAGGCRHGRKREVLTPLHLAEPHRGLPDFSTSLIVHFAALDPAAAISWHHVVHGPIHFALDDKPLESKGCTERVRAGPPS